MSRPFGAGSLPGVGRRVRVFITYHHADTPEALAGRLHDALESALGRDAVSWDQRSFVPGAMLDYEMNQGVRESDVVLALIGPRWEHEIFEPESYVYQELREAARLHRPVIPVLVGRTTQLNGQMPTGLEHLPQRISMPLRTNDLDFRTDVNRIVEASRQVAAPRARRSRAAEGRAVGVAALVAVAVLAGILVAVRAISHHESAGTSQPASRRPSDSGTVSTAAPSSTSPPPPRTDGTLRGMLGLVDDVEIDDSFKERLRSVSPGLDTFDYAAHAYDAVVTVALAAEMAHRDGTALASALPGITTVGTRCTTYAGCRAVIRSGGDPDYDGLTGPIELDASGEPTVGTYSVRRFTADDRIDKTPTKPIAAHAAQGGPAPRLTSPVVRPRDGVLRIGALLPLEGDEDSLGRSQSAAIDLAIADIEAAGGVLGATVELVGKDSGYKDEDRAAAAADELVAAGVDVIIGPTDSASALRMLDRVTAAGVLLVSPANTWSRLSSAADRGLYFRFAPSDALEAEALGDAMVGAHVEHVSVVTAAGPYGQDLAAQLHDALVRRHVEVEPTLLYDANAATFDTQTDAVRRAGTDAVVLIGAAESSRVLRALVDHGVGPPTVALFGCDLNLIDGVGERFEQGR